MKCPVAETPAADSAAAVAQFEALFAFETDCWDVHASLSKGGGNFVLLDVRSPSDYERGHVPGAINLPHGKIIASKLIDWPADTLFVVYCAGPHCNGADGGALRLARLGRPVKRMIGGVTGWLDDGFALVSGPEAGALRSSSAKTQDLHNRFAEAWGSADAARVAALMTHNCVTKLRSDPSRAGRFVESKNSLPG
jgi:rhodanese-related sulfurtransferase